mmetsp:Transcript_29341/g.52787  ORF Transcript_29341/g.52787 Transcript_29341/m.52787 type:complete len:98 (-) Transcript_29341:20-313(-)
MPPPHGIFAAMFAGVLAILLTGASSSALQPPSLSRCEQHFWDGPCWDEREADWPQALIPLLCGGVCAFAQVYGLGLGSPLANTQIFPSDGERGHGLV